MLYNNLGLSKKKGFFWKSFLFLLVVKRNWIKGEKVTSLTTHPQVRTRENMGLKTPLEIHHIFHTRIFFSEGNPFKKANAEAFIKKQLFLWNLACFLITHKCVKLWGPRCLAVSPSNLKKKTRARETCNAHINRRNWIKFTHLATRMCVI